MIGPKESSHKRRHLPHCHARGLLLENHSSVSLQT